MIDPFKSYCGPPPEVPGIVRIKTRSGVIVDVPVRDVTVDGGEVVLRCKVIGIDPRKETENASR